MKALTDELKQSQREIDNELSEIVAQLRRQADSTFNGQSWGKAGEADFGDALIAHGKRLIELGEKFNSGNLPQWKLDQEAAYEQSAIGRLKRLKHEQ